MISYFIYTDVISYFRSGFWSLTKPNRTSLPDHLLFLSNNYAAPCDAFYGVALTSRSARQILVHVGVFVRKPKAPSPALNKESILVKILW